MSRSSEGSIFERNPVKTTLVLIFVFLSVIEVVSKIFIVLTPQPYSTEGKMQVFDSYVVFRYRENLQSLLKFRNVSEPSVFETGQKGLIKTFGQPKNPEKRILILGGSTVFGVGASSYKSTIASYLQNILNQKFPSKYIVYNGGVRGFYSFQEYIWYLNDMRPLSPDIVISLNGRNDAYMGLKDRLQTSFVTDYSESLEEPFNSKLYLAPKDLTSEVLAFKSNTITGLKRIAKATNLGRAITLIAERSKPFSNTIHPPYLDTAPKYFPSDSKVDAAVRNYSLAVSALRNAVVLEGKKHIWALQPIAFYGKTLSSDEHKRIKESLYLNEVKNYPQAIRTFYQKTKDQNPEIVDLTQLFSKVTQTVYTDDCHYNDLGNKIIAEALVPLVSN